MIVSDTNLIAYYVIPSDWTDRAVEVRRKDKEWAVPPLWRSELCNLLATSMRNGVMSLEDAILTFDNAIGAIGQNEMKIDPKRVLELAESSGCTAYDCEYVSLAERLNVPLVTSDKKLLSAFPDIAVSMETFVAETSV